MGYWALHGKKGRIVFLEEPFAGSELGLFTLGESLLGMDEADANGLERYIEFMRAYTWRLLTEVEEADTSHFTKEWREFIPGMGKFTGRMEGIYDGSEDDGQKLLNEFMEFKRFYVEAHLYGKTDVGYMRAGLMVTDRAVDTSIRDAIKISFDFVNHGYPEWVPAGGVDLTANLIAHWKFDEGSGAVAQDSAPYDIDGTLVGNPSWVAGKYNTALQFSSGSHVAITKKHPLSSRYFLSVSLWFKPTGAPVGGVHGLIGDSAGSDGWRITVDHATGKVSWTIGSTTVTSVDAINPSEWNHIVCTYHPVAGRMKIWINKVEDMNVGSRTGAVPQNANQIKIGSIAGDTEGIIDDVRIYGVELNANPVDPRGIIPYL